jgi:hypothetical protein
MYQITQAITPTAEPLQHRSFTTMDKCLGKQNKERISEIINTIMSMANPALRMDIVILRAVTSTGLTNTELNCSFLFSHARQFTCSDKRLNSL